MKHCLIIGGGAVGLSLAYELAGRGIGVRVIDAGQPGREASWAGAGILPPAVDNALDPLDALFALSNALHAQWSQELRRQTQIDNGYAPCGGIYLADDRVEADRLQSLAALARPLARRLNHAELARLEPELSAQSDSHGAFVVDQECQLRNPRHLKALLAACALRGVEINAGVAAHDFETRGDRLISVRTGTGSVPVDTVCVTTGAWTMALVERLGCHAAIRPVRGQIALLSSPRRLLSRIVNVGSRYLVPRNDGRILAGSTEEDAGFDRSTTAAAIEGLLAFAIGLVPALAGAQLERTWAGLRPSSADGLPYLGVVPGLENAFVAAGHFRSGLQLSPGTAVVMSQLMRGEPPQIDLTPFRLDRHPAAAPREREASASRPRPARPVRQTSL